MDEARTRWRHPHFISTALADVDVRVSSLHGTDEIGSPFELQLVLQIDQDDPIDMGELLEAPAALYWTRSGGPPEGAFYGVVREAEMLESRPNHWIQYRVVLVSPLWLLTQTLRSRVFCEMTVPEIVERVLGDAGFVAGVDFEWAIEDAYPCRRHVVQYQETDHDFICRLLEHEGIFMYGDSDLEHERLVLGDRAAAFNRPAEAELVFSAAAEDDAIDRRIFSLQHRHTSVPRHLVTRDYDPTMPGVSLQREQSVVEGGIGMVYLTDDHPFDDHDIARLARVRAQELAVSEDTYRVTGMALGLRAGQQVDVVGHYIDDFNASYVVASVDYEQGHGERGACPIVTAELVRADVPYRPARITRRPRIYGILPGHVDGPVVGVPAPLDPEGRYKVLLPFDGAGTPGGRASCWLRLAQTFAGPGYGMHFPLHVGTEVLVAHVDGDPDRPLIVGAVPNPVTSTPVVEDNATQSVIRTKAGIVQEYEDDARVES